MNLRKGDNKNIDIERLAEYKQINITVNGCKVRLNFPVKPEGSALNDIKQMMLSGAIRT